MALDDLIQSEKPEQDKDESVIKGKQGGYYDSSYCPVCEEDGFMQISHHWRQSCEYPDIPDRMMDILIGHIMGDGTINSSVNSRVQWIMSNLMYMRWLDIELKWLTNGVSRYKTAEESAEEVANRDMDGFSDIVKAENYSDLYRSQTVKHPQLNHLDWMEDGKKKFPEDLELNKLIAKVWYCDDGTLNWGERGRPFCSMAARSQSDNEELLLSLFEDVGLSPSIYNNDGLIQFSADETEAFLLWLGSAPPGMEYKFCTESKEMYEKLKTNGIRREYE